MAKTPSGWRARSVPGVLALAALVVAGRPLGAQTRGPGAGSARPAFDEASFLSDLDRRLERAALGPEASQRSLRQAGERLLGERIGKWRLESLWAGGGGRNAPAEARRMHVLLSRLEQRLRLLVSRRVEACATALARPLPPPSGPPVAPVRQPGDTGGISGTVTGPVAVSGGVHLTDAAGGLSVIVGIPGDGRWSASWLLPGTYYARTVNDSGLIDEAWNDRPCPFYTPNPKRDCGAAPIKVTAGMVTTGIDFTLVAGGRISGAVTASASSAPLPGVLVWVLDDVGRQRAIAHASADGLYTSDQGLPSGRYYVKTSSNYASPPGFLDEGYDNVPCEPSCPVSLLTPVVVTSPATTGGIDFALDSAGALSGRVTDEGTGLPVEGVSVYLDGHASDWGRSAPDGTYTVSGLHPGTYRAGTDNSSGYIDEVYDDHPCFVGCDLGAGDPIGVTSGATTGGIDFALAPGGSISGRVTRSDTAEGLANVGVAAWINAWGWAYSAVTTTTDATGRYTLTGLDPGRYFVSTAAADGGQNFIDEIYGGVPCVGCSPYYLPISVDYQDATLVAVAAGSTTPDIDFALAPGGEITGTVTRAGTGTAVSGRVEVYSRPAGASVASVYAPGAYVVKGLPTGQYAVRAEGHDGEIPEFYDDVTDPPSLLEVTPVHVTAGAVTSGIDFVLALGGRVSGTVTRADTGDPVYDARVSVYGAAGTEVSSATTDAEGHYVSELGVPTGKYNVFASPPLTGTGLVTRLYKEIDCPSWYPWECAPGSGDAVSVTSRSTTSGIDFALPVGGTISGTVLEEGSRAAIPVASASAIVVDGSGHQISQGAAVSSGAFEITGLSPGGYYVLVDGWAAYVNEVYDDVACTACDVRLGQRVDVRAGARRAGVDFVLTRGGAIGGRVTSAATGLGLPGWVWVFSATGQWVRDVWSTSSGNYSISGLAPGSYRVLAAAREPGYVDQLYGGIPCPAQSCTIAGGTPVTVTAGATTGVDFVLAAGASITGSVRDTTGQAAWGGYVFGFSGGYAWVQSNGRYRLTGLPPGAQYVGAVATDLVREAWDDVPCFGCDPAASGATAVAVVAGAETSGIDFTLGEGASIGGSVTSAGQPVGGVTVLFRKSGSSQDFSANSTRADGTYRQYGVPPGTYYAVATKDGFDSRLYDGLACPGSCDPTAGTPIAVAGTEPVTGIDFSLSTRSLDFYTVPPCRMLDTRDAEGGLGDPALACRGDRNFPLAGTCGVPFDAKALSLNVTATGSTAGGHLRLHAGRTAIPATSSLNYATGQTRASNAIVPLGTIGEIGIYCAQPSGTVHVIVDVGGYFK